MLHMATMKVILGLCCLFIAYQGNIVTCQGSDSIYGPKSVSVRLSDDTKIPFDICTGKTDKITTICEVPVEDVSPEPRFTLYLNGTPVGSSRPGKMEGSVYRYTHTFKPDVGGPLRMKCLAENSQSRELTEEAELEMVVREGPQSYIIINITKDSSIYFQEGDTVNVTCTVLGGYPQVSNVTLSCHSHGTVTDQGNVATLNIINITREMNFEYCNCTAQHVTGCFPFSMSSSVNVPYPPRITNLTANGQSESVVVDPGSDVTLSCEADANGKPDIYFRRSRLNKNEFEYKQYYALQANFTLKDVTCNDSDAYICIAKNVIWTPAVTHPTTQKSIDVIVKCPQQLQKTYTGTEIQDFSVKLHNNVDIKVGVYGYPQPTAFSLQRGNDSVIDLKLDQTGNNHKYTLKYIPDVAAYGDVILTINSVKQEDLTRYTVTISNEMGTPVNYMFSVSEDTTNKAIGIKLEVVLTLVSVLVAAFLTLE